MRKTLFLIVVTLQFSLFCFAQSNTSHKYTDAEILKISNYIKGLEAKESAVNLTLADKTDKVIIAGFLIRTPPSYTDNEVIKLAAYIKRLENKTSVAGGASASLAGNGSADSLTSYTNPEIAKFTKYIDDLEKRISSNSELQSDPEQKRKITAILSVPTHEFNDSELVILADYIKVLEKTDVLNTPIVKAKEDSVAVVLAIAKVEANKTVEEKQIDKIAKLIFFDFNSSSLKAESYKPLEEVVKLVKSQAGLNFVVEGYCESKGSDEYNLSLSKRRAETVKGYFISKGIPSTQISAVGYGEANPIATNETDEGRAKNRRVEIKTKK